MAEPTTELQLFDAIEDYVSRVTAPLQKQIEGLQARLTEYERRLTAVANQDDVELDYSKVEEMLKATVTPVLAALPVPKNGEPGVRGPAGKDAEVDYDKIGNIIAVAVEKEFGKIQPPKDGEPGKDAVVDYGMVKEFINAAVITTVAAQPKPEPGRDGKSVDVSEVEAMVEKAVAARAVPDLSIPIEAINAGFAERIEADVELKVSKALADRPDPAPWYPREIIEARIDASVAEAVKAIRPEPGPAGRDADEAAIAERVLGEVVKQLPTVRDGKDADEDAIAARVLAEVVKQIPEPAPATDPDFVRAEVAKGLATVRVDEDGIVERVRSLIPDEDAIVGKVLAQIPKPKDGDSVHPDTVALMVRDAIEEFAKSVELPKDGKPGRDALDLEILDRIEAGKSYPAGTFALHAGGTVLALRDTDPIELGLEEAGWKVTQDGIADVDSKQISERTWRITFTRTSGIQDVKDFTPSFANVDKGPYRPGMKYLAGDGVSRDGSFWIARVDTEASPPHDDWRLAVKRGRDGR